MHVSHRLKITVITLGHHDPQRVVFQPVMPPNMKQRMTTGNHAKRVKFDDVNSAHNLVCLRIPSGGAIGKKPPARNMIDDVRPNRNPVKATKNSPQISTRCIHKCKGRNHPVSFGPGLLASPRRIISANHNNESVTKISAKIEWI